MQGNRKSWGLQQCKLSYLKGCHFNLMLKLSERFQQVVFAGVCLFVCVHARVLVFVCAWSACHSVLITSSHTCFPRRLSPPPTSHVSSSKPDPATVVASLFHACVPLPLSSWSGSGSTATTPLVSLCCPSSKTLLVSYDTWEGNSCSLADVQTGAVTLVRIIKH